MVLTVCCQCRFMWNLLLLVAQQCSKTVVLKGVCAICKRVKQKKKRQNGKKKGGSLQ